MDVECRRTVEKLLLFQKQKQKGKKKITLSLSSWTHHEKRIQLITNKYSIHTAVLETACIFEEKVSILTLANTDL